MSFDSMRVGGGRCPPLLVIGLIIACIMMVCNWWSLSSTNMELLRQIDELNEQIKISMDERDQCVTQRGVFERNLKSCEDKGRTAHVQLSQTDDRLSSCNENLSECSVELKSMKQLDVSKTATLEALRADKKAAEAQLEKKKEESEKLREQSERMRQELSEAREDTRKLKMTLDVPAAPKQERQEQQIPSAQQAEKSPVADPNLLPHPQLNAPPNLENAESPVHDEVQEKDNNSNLKDDNAAEVNDGANPMDNDINFNLMSEVKIPGSNK